MQLVDWMVDAKNPFFAKAVANRYWAHFFGRGIVDPLDDMRVTNPPSNPELLDALAEDLVEEQVQPEAPDPDDLQEPDVSAELDAERVQQARQAIVRPLLSEADVGGSAVRRGVAGDRQPGRRSTACRATSSPRTGRSCCRTSRSSRTSWTCSAGRSGSARANASASARPTWPRRCTCSTRTKCRTSCRDSGGRAGRPGEGPAARRRRRSRNCSSGAGAASRRKPR